MKNKEVIAQLLAIKKLGCLTDKDRQALALAIKSFEGRPHYGNCGADMRKGEE